MKREERFALFSLFENLIEIVTIYGDLRRLLSPGAPPAPVRLPGQKFFLKKFSPFQKVDWTVEVGNKRWKLATFLKASKRPEKRANRK